MQRQHLDYHYTKHSQELRVSSPSEDRFPDHARRVLPAAATNDIDAQYIIDGISSADLASIVWFQPIIGDTVYLKRLARRDNDYALFGQFDFDITDDLTLTGGIRGFKVDNTLLGFSGYSYNIDASCLPSSDPDIPCYNVFEDGATTADPKTIKETGGNPQGQPVRTTSTPTG